MEVFWIIRCKRFNRRPVYKIFIREASAVAYLARMMKMSGMIGQARKCLWDEFGSAMRTKLP